METVRIDTAQMRPTDAFVRMLASPISPVDLAQVRQRYTEHTSLYNAAV